MNRQHPDYSDRFEHLPLAEQKDILASQQTAEDLNAYVASVFQLISAPVRVIAAAISAGARSGSAGKAA